MRNSLEKCVATFTASVSDAVELRNYYSDGREERKCVKFSDFRQILAAKENHTSIANVSMNVIPDLPKGYYKGAVGEQGENSFKVLIVIPAGRRMLNYYGDNMEVPFPELLFSSTVVNGNQVDSRMFVINSNKLSAETKLYHYPFGNVYGDGHICWGNNVINGIKKMSDVDRIVVNFFGSETNDDLFVPSHGIRTQRELLKKIEEEVVFPEKYLCEVEGSSVGLMFGTLFE